MVHLLTGAAGRPLSLVATCASGLERFVAAELVAMGFDRPGAPLVIEEGGVRFVGDWRDVWQANLWLRTANRVLVALARWRAADDTALASGANQVAASNVSWDGVAAADLFSPDRSLAVHATSTNSAVADTRWVAVRVKDGLVDGQRDRFGRRSSVDREDPTLAFRLRLLRDEATLLLDTSGLSLDHRGYRAEAGRAPVRESLAAACVLAGLDGWVVPDRPVVVDPMCGTGTLLVEAAWSLLGWSPSRMRERFAFERLPGYLPSLAGQLRAAARSERRPAERGLRLIGRDLDAAATRLARDILQDADLGPVSSVTTADAFAIERPQVERGLLLVNPPWGERMAEGRAQWARLGELLRQRFGGFRAVVLAGDVALGGALGIEPVRRIAVRSGALPAAILVFDL